MISIVDTIFVPISLTFPDLKRNPEYMFDGIESYYINPDRLSRTVRLVPIGYGQNTAYGEILNAFLEARIDQQDGVFKVSSFDKSYSVLFSYSDKVERYMGLEELKCGSQRFAIMCMSEQIVSLRIHWLPVYYNNSILREIFGEWGKVLSVDMLKTAHENHVILDGTREVKLKTDELSKQQIPHVVNFRSGQKVLVTMAGRPPYCLKCRSIGHVRNKCPGSRGYAAAVTNDLYMVETDSQPDLYMVETDSQPAGPSQPTADPVKNHPPATAAPVDQPTESTGSAGGPTKSHDGD